MNTITKDLDYYAKRFIQLRRGQDTYNTQKPLSPYKPILILSILEMIDKGFILENKIYVEEDWETLENIFCKYQKILGGRYKDQKEVLCQPFFNLINDGKDETGEGFWHLTNKPGTPKLRDIRDAEGRNRIKDKKTLNRHIEYGRFDDELWELLQDQEDRQYLMDVLVDTFFSDTNNQVEDIIINFFNQTATKEQGLIEPKNTEKKYVKRKSVARNPIFSRSVIHIYKYQCAVCGIKMKTKGLIRDKNIVDAAHIVPFSVAYNNQLSNGISLCKNHHWAFDNGCFSIKKISENKYLVIVSENFHEDVFYSRENVNIMPLSKYHEQTIFLPDNSKYYPSHEALVWHQNKHQIQ